MKEAKASPEVPIIVIRSAELRDLPMIVKMIHELAVYEKAPEQCHATVEAMEVQLFGGRPYAEAVVGEIDGVVGAMAIYFFNFSTWEAAPGLYLEDLYVRPTFRRYGVGKAMLERLALIAEERDCVRFEWSVLDWNKPARDFYEGLGAQPMCEWVKYRTEGAALKALAEAGRTARKKQLAAEKQNPPVESPAGDSKFDPEGQLVRVHTDGGASPNPGVGAWAAVLEASGKRLELSGGELETTNNRMELLAAINALEALPPGQQVLIHTDSQYLKNGITTWIKSWKKNNWMRGTGKDKEPVKNEELWKRLDAVVQKHRLGWEWVRGHSGNQENERCDELCRLKMEDMRRGNR